MKQYNLAGVGANVDLGKAGVTVAGSDSAQVSFTDSSANAVVAVIAQGTEASHGITKAQLDASTTKKLSKVSVTVNYDDSNVSIGTAAANTYVHKVVVEAETAWTGADSTTEITVGDSGDVDRLFSSFDPEIQTADETDHKYTSDTALTAFVTQGGASAGTAEVTVWYTGTVE